MMTPIQTNRIHTVRLPWSGECARPKQLQRYLRKPHQSKLFAIPALLRYASLLFERMEADLLLLLFGIALVSKDTRFGFLSPNTQGNDFHLARWNPAAVSRLVCLATILVYRRPGKLYLQFHICICFQLSKYTMMTSSNNPFASMVRTVSNVLPNHWRPKPYLIVLRPYSYCTSILVILAMFSSCFVEPFNINQLPAKFL
jgi:hypothetical protein